MVQRICPYCRCEDSCGREAFASRPSPDEGGPSPTEVHAAVFEFYSHNPSALDVNSWDLAQRLVRLGYLNSMPSLADIEHAQQLIREVER